MANGMKTLVLLLLLLAAPVHAASNLQPSGGQAAVNTTLTWTGDASATSYQIYIVQGVTGLYGVPLIAPASAVGCAGGGTCTYSLPSALGAGQLVGWQVAPIYPGNSGPYAWDWSPMVTFYAADPSDATFPLNTMASSSCTSWRQVSDYPGQTRLIWFVNTGGGPGVGIFPKSTWRTLDVSDLVPSTAKAMRVLVEAVYSASCDASYKYCDLIGFQTRRHGSSQATGGIWYTVSPRHWGEYTVLLNGGKFDFLWDTVPANGINVAQTNGSTVGGEELAARLIEYCE